MARPFTSTDIEQLIEKHKNIVHDLKNTENIFKQYTTEIIETADVLVKQETIKIIKEIPIEEIAKYKNGLQIETLRKYGFKSFWDIYNASIYDITKIEVISNNEAKFIKQLVDKLFEQYSKNIKIRISEDNKSPIITKLIVSLNKYKSGLPYAKIVTNLLENINKIHSAIENVKDYRGIFRWLQKQKKRVLLIPIIYYLILLMENMVIVQVLYCES